MGFTINNSLKFNIAGIHLDILFKRFNWINTKTTKALKKSTLQLY